MNFLRLNEGNACQIQIMLKKLLNFQNRSTSQCRMLWYNGNFLDIPYLETLL